MAIGTVPLIPLHRVQSDPNSRFQRFGVDDSQLFGKPLVDFASQPQRAVSRTERVPSEELQQGKGQAETELPKSGALELGSTYSGKVENRPGTVAAPKPGSYVNLKA